jgi:hypothetical protein
MLQQLKKYWEEQPLTVALLAGAFFRLISVIFSKGYGMHDDHFLVIESAQSWVAGTDYNNWLPEFQKGEPKPTGHSLFYSGIHYIYFEFLELLHIKGPQTKMFFVRLLHAAYSLLVVYFGYKIAFKAAGKKVAGTVALLLALIWFWPVMSVRNLVEMVSIPPLIAATWILYKNEDNKKLSIFILAGLIAGFAMAFRFQSVLFIGGMGLALLLQRKWLGSIIFGVGAAVSFSLSQLSDIFIWGQPFVETATYIQYNIDNAETYFKQGEQLYFLFIGGMLIPPISLLLMFGFARKWKKHLVLFLPALLFFAFHTYFPNKQERFILPVIPFLITLGYIGWHEFYSNSKFWAKNIRLHRVSWGFFWTINTTALLIFSPSYTKKSRVESMIYLSEQKDFQSFIIDCSHRGDFPMPPKFYLNDWGNYYWVVQGFPLERLIDAMPRIPEKHQPNYVVFAESGEIKKRVAKYREFYPEMKLKATIEPGNIDQLLYWLNPKNRNDTYYIYKLY